MSMSGLSGRPALLARSAGANSSSSPLSSLMPSGYRCRRSSGSSGSRSLQGPASAVLERRQQSTTPPPPPKQQQPPSPTVTIHETSEPSLESRGVSKSVDVLDDTTTTEDQQAMTASSTLPLPELDPSPVIAQSRSDNVLSISDRAVIYFNHATSNGFLRTT